MDATSTAKFDIDACTILRGEVGSVVHGMATGSDDKDEMGVCIEPLAHAWATEGEFEQHLFRSAAQREGRHDAPSRAGDLDLIVYSLKKWCRLALKGNPSVLLLLFLPPDRVVASNALGSQLRDLAPAFASKRAVGAFLGYMQAQRQRLAGERGQRGVTRQELVDKYGFDCYSDDTEFLTHAGWKYYDDIADGEEVGTINQTSRELEFQTPVDRIAKPYMGDMIQLTHRYSNAFVTPNHRMWVSKVCRGNSGRNGNAYHPARANWRFARADDHFDATHVQVSCAQRHYEWAVSDDYLRLVGCYASEGCIGKRLQDGTPSVVRINQLVGGRLEAIVKATSYPFKRYAYHRPVSATRRKACDEVTYTLADRPLASALVRDCSEGSHSKHLPSWALHLSARQANVLLDALVAGDGTTYKRTGYRIYYTISRRLAGDVQALALSAGYRSTMWGPYESGIYQVLITTGSLFQCIKRSHNVKTITPTHPLRIVCFTVRNETLVTRRNGRVAMHGNTKYAGHILRLGYQGLEYGMTGKLTLPLPEPQRSYLVGVRTGQVTLNDVLTEAGRLERELLDLRDTSPLPDEPDTARVNDWMRSAYLGWWYAEAASADVRRRMMEHANLLR